MHPQFCYTFFGNDFEISIRYKKLLLNTLNNTLKKYILKRKEIGRTLFGITLQTLFRTFLCRRLSCLNATKSIWIVR